MKRAFQEQEGAASTTFEELLRERLEGARDIGVLTYCVVTGNDPPSWVNLNIRNLPGRGNINLNAVRSSLDFGRGLLWIGIGIQDSPADGVEKNPASVLSAYEQLLEVDVQRMKKAAAPLRSTEKRILQSNPEFSADPLFQAYWQDVIVLMRDDKAFYQYSLTQMRATALGFGAAAEEFNDPESMNRALEIAERYKETGRKDPLEIVGFIKKF